MAKLTRKSYQRKAMVVGATAFAGVALVATGFAAWVISSSATEKFKGNVQVGTISEKSIEITDIALKEVDGTRDFFSFEPTKTDVSGRVRYDGKDNYENLSLVVTGKYKPASYVNKFSIGLRMGTFDGGGNFTPDETAEKRIEDAAKVSNYINLPDCWAGAPTGGDGVTFNTKGTEFTSTDGNGKITVGADGVASFTYTISFEWGDHFKDGSKNLNPSEFYDSTTGKADYDDKGFKTDLAAFYKAMTGIEYKPGETATAPAADYTTMQFAVIIKADTAGSAA